MTTEEREDAICEIETGTKVHLASKPVEDEIIHRWVVVYGNDDLGYIASSEEWFTAADKKEPEFFEVLFQTPIYPTIEEALADAMPSAEKEASNIGQWQETQAQEEPLPNIEPSDYEFDTGYVGSLGHTFTTTTHETFMATIEAATKFNNIATNDVIDMLMAGEQVKWQKSPNYYYDHSYGIIRKKRTRKPVEMYRCDCGHSVPRSLVMSASAGSSCPDCYDRMSD